MDTSKVIFHENTSDILPIEVLLIIIERKRKNSPPFLSNEEELSVCLMDD